MDGDIEQLKSLALSLNEELKNLHSKQLFSNFKSNQMEFLLEDLKNGKFDDSKLKLQKRVEWHILNSFTGKSDLSNDIFEQNRSCPNTSNEQFKDKKDIFQEDPIYERKPLIKDVGNPRKSYSSPIRKYSRHDILLQSQEPANKKKSHTMAKKHSGSFKKKKLKCDDQSDRQFQSDQQFRKSSKLEVILNPCINIPPLCKNSLPSVNIKPKKIYSHNSIKYKPKILKEKASILKPSLQKVINNHVNIAPLTHQKLHNISLLPPKSKSNTFPNQAVITCKYSRLSPENTDASVVETSLPIRMDISEKSKDSSTSESSFSGSNRRIRERIIYDTRSQERDSSSQSTDQHHMHLSEKEFDSKRFIDRLEERLSSVLISLPNAKFIEKEAERVQKKISDKESIESSSDRSRSKSLNPVNLKVSKSVKFSEASSQAGNSCINNKFSKDEFVQTCPTKNQILRVNSGEFYNSSFESDESLEKDEEVSDALERNPSLEKDDVRMDRHSTGEKKFSESIHDEKQKHEDDSENINEGKLKFSDDNKEYNGQRDSSNSATSIEIESSHSKELQSSESYIQNKESPLRQASSSKKNVNENEVKEQQNSDEICPIPMSANSSECKTSTKEENLQENSQKSKTSTKEDDLQENSHKSKTSTKEEDLQENSHKSKTSTKEEDILNDDLQENSHKSSENHLSKETNPEYSIPKEVDSLDAVKKGKESSENSNVSTLISSAESAFEEETILPFIEIGDVTISEGEIEFEASISDFQPCNRIAIKFSTKDFGISAIHPNQSPDSALIDKETQTDVCDHNSDLVYDSSYSEGILQLQSERERSVLSDVCEENEETLINISEGELLGKESPSPEVVLDDDQKKSLQRENEILRQRLSAFTGRFCIP